MSIRLPDYTGLSFGRLTVLRRADSPNTNSYWLCRCECGTAEKAVMHGHLRMGLIRSCGCLRTETSTKHGKTKTPTYYSWQNMVGRCTNPKLKDWSRYGGAGITVCPEWRKFANFYADMGDKPPGCSLERIDSKGNYEPGNCVWATAQQQANNTSRNVFITHNGKTQTVADWARELGINRKTLGTRLQRGWSVDRALAA